ncbi:MAG: hypothetical protein OXR72_07050 [Gemmatimonadota bacterium]|nr:hypothetical protein [Gemmatimonadota bacterium]
MKKVADEDVPEGRSTSNTPRLNNRGHMVPPLFVTRADIDELAETVNPGIKYVGREF